MANLRDCIYGLAVGDALGVPFEFRHRDSFICDDMVGYGTYNLTAGTWSDDTSMTLALCDSYRVLGRVDVDDIRNKFESWLDDGEYTVDGVFDVGWTTKTAIRQKKGMSGFRDNGNGSLMRIAPMAFMDASDDEVRAVSSITHAHEISTECCVTYVRAVKKLIGGASIADVVSDEISSMDRSSVESDGFVRNTLSAALWCLSNSDSYAECVLNAVNFGEDSDTTAAVAGALAGVVYGYDAIPRKWIEALRGKDLIDSCLF